MALLEGMMGKHDEIEVRGKGEGRMEEMECVVLCE